MNRKTPYTKPADVKRSWHLIDADGKVLGRLAAEVAKLLRGKHKPEFSPSVDAGDHVVVVNAEKVVVTGRKAETKVYRRYTGYPGGLRDVPYRRMLAKHPERILEIAVRGMLPKNKLGRAQFKKLKVYAGPEHRHEAQNPTALEV